MIPIEIQPILWTFRHLSQENLEKARTEQKYFTHLLKVNERLIEKMFTYNMSRYKLNNSTSNEDKEEFKQDILVIIWECLLSYDALKKATFSTFVIGKVNYYFQKIYREQLKDKINISALPIEDYSEILPDYKAVNLSSKAKLNKIRTATPDEAKEFLIRYNAQIELKKALRKQSQRKVKPFEQLSARQQRRRKKS